MKTKAERAAYYKQWFSERSPEQLARTSASNKISARKYYLRNREKIIFNSRFYTLQQQKLYPHKFPTKRKSRYVKVVKIPTKKNFRVIRKRIDNGTYFFLKKTTILNYYLYEYLI